MAAAMPANPFAASSDPYVALIEGAVRARRAAQPHMDAPDMLCVAAQVAELRALRVVPDALHILADDTVRARYGPHYVVERDPAGPTRGIATSHCVFEHTHAGRQPLVSFWNLRTDADALRAAITARARLLDGD
jgi:hypothetical protein